MEAVYILCNQGKGGGLPLHSRQRKMRRVGDLRGNNLPAPVIPLPHELRVPAECLRCGKFLCPEIPPQAVLPSEGRNSAVGRDAGAGQHTNRDCLGQLGAYSADIFLHFCLRCLSCLTSGHIGGIRKSRLSDFCYGLIPPTPLLKRGVFVGGSASCLAITLACLRSALPLPRVGIASI